MQPDSEATPWRQIALFLMTLGVLVVTAFLLKPFLVAIVGAIVIAVVTERPYQWLAGKIGRPNLCATVALLLIVISIIVPTFFLAQSVGQQVANVVTALRSETTHQKIADYFSRHPALASRILAISNSIDLPNTTKSVAAFFGAKVAGIIGSSIGAITQIVILLFILFFLYRDRALAGAFARSLLPLDDDEASVLMDRLRGTIYATALGRLAIAAIQGTLGGLAYGVLDVPNAFLWGILTAIMAMVPAFGAFLVWIPIALFLGFSGHWSKAALLAAWGGGVVSTIDNFLYPVMVGPHLRQHTVAVLLSILGGIALFGITGIILGPLAFAAASTLLEIWKTRTAQRDTNKDLDPMASRLR
ncbi:AI-2E family transporter [Edaphobacter aggregans]|uniref:AI-2E family transporter n=1 Tax=Edaphobacter aggregans TaxID=570835 RepID=UPI00068E9D57|nr:AI-2E family transporter [Edaphobacter aggregans]